LFLNIFKLSLYSISTIILLTGCAGNKIDVLSYPKKIKTKVIIPNVCSAEYKSVLPSVAVIDFTNNSTFGQATISNSNSKSNANRKAVGVTSVVATPLGIGIPGASLSNTRSKTKSSTVHRNVDAKLSASITGPLESIIINSGGVKLFTRSEMDKIDSELKFQDSGLVDPSSVVEFGKTSGVRYIITGSIDNVKQNNRDNFRIAYGLNSVIASSRSSNDVKIAGALLSLGTALTDGMTISTKLTVKLLDVQTGKILFSKQLEDEINIGRVSGSNYDQVVGGIKASMINALPSLEEELTSHFLVKGYITQLRSKDSDIIAQVNIGSDLKVTEDQLFKVYVFEENEDPISGKVSCDVLETTTKLRASQQITKGTTWATIQEGDSSILKLGQLVQKTQEKAGFGF